MRGINKLLTVVAVTLCFFVGAASANFVLMSLSIVIAVAALIIEAYDVPDKLRRRPKL